MEITNFDWSSVGEDPSSLLDTLIFSVAACVILFSIGGLGIFILKALEKKFPRLREFDELSTVAVAVPALIAMFSFMVLTVLTVDKDPADEARDALLDDLENTYDVSIFENTSTGNQKFGYHDWERALGTFSGWERYREHVLAREDGKSDVEAVLLFEKDSADADDFTVSLVIPQKGEEGTDLIDYKTGEPISEKTGNTEEEETD